MFEATRSCTHPCDFCVAPAVWDRNQVQKPVDQVVAGIRRAGTKKGLFVDLNLISDRRYARDLFTALIPPGIRWYGLATSLIGHDAELMELLARSGCAGLLIGFETDSEAGLGAVRKGFNTPALYAQLINDLHRLGIAVNGTFVFGGDADTVETVRETTAFVLETGIDLPPFRRAHPLPRHTALPAARGRGADSDPGLGALRWPACVPAEGDEHPRGGTGARGGVERGLFLARGGKANPACRATSTARFHLEPRLPVLRPRARSIPIRGTDPASTRRCEC